MARQQIFDAHHHLWALDECRYPWLMARGVKRFFGDPAPIQKDYLLENFLSDAGEYALLGSTHIQVGVEENDAAKETAWLQSLADTPVHLPSAIVAFADLRRDDLDALLADHQRASNFRGVRQIVGRHPDEDRNTNTGVLLNDIRFRRGLQILGKHDLSFDLQLVESQYHDAFSLLKQIPDLRIAICHFASPWDLSKTGFDRWRAAMSEFAKLPRTHMKFSGFGMFRPDWAHKDIKPYVETALELFGADRCMTGSNFPVDKLYGGYSRIWRAMDELIKNEATRSKVTVETAARFYRVDLPDNSSNSERSDLAPSRIKE